MTDGASGCVVAYASGKSNGRGWSGPAGAGAGAGSITAAAGASRGCSAKGSPGVMMTSSPCPEASKRAFTCRSKSRSHSSYVNPLRVS